MRIAKRIEKCSYAHSSALRKKLLCAYTPAPRPGQNNPNPRDTQKRPPSLAPQANIATAIEKPAWWPHALPAGPTLSGPCPWTQNRKIFCSHCQCSHSAKSSPCYAPIAVPQSELPFVSVDASMLLSLSKRKTRQLSVVKRWTY